MPIGLSATFLVGRTLSDPPNGIVRCLSDSRRVVAALDLPSCHSRIFRRGIDTDSCGLRHNSCLDQCKHGCCALGHVVLVPHELYALLCRIMVVENGRVVTASNATPVHCLEEVVHGVPAPGRSAYLRKKLLGLSFLEFLTRTAAAVLCDVLHTSRCLQDLCFGRPHLPKACLSL